MTLVDQGGDGDATTTSTSRRSPSTTATTRSATSRSPSSAANGVLGGATATHETFARRHRIPRASRSAPAPTRPRSSPARSRPPGRLGDDRRRRQLHLHAADRLHRDRRQRRHLHLHAARRRPRRQLRQRRRPHRHRHGLDRRRAGGLVHRQHRARQPALGTQANPFTSIAAFNAANGDRRTVPRPGDTIYLRDGTGTYTEADGFNLLNNQTVIGQGENLTITPTGGGPAITIETGSAGQTPTVAGDRRRRRRRPARAGQHAQRLRHQHDERFGGRASRTAAAPSAR